MADSPLRLAIRHLPTRCHNGLARTDLLQKLSAISYKPSAISQQTPRRPSAGIPARSFQPTAPLLYQVRPAYSSCSSSFVYGFFQISPLAWSRATRG